MSNVCRLCLNNISNDASTPPSYNTTALKAKINYLLPEIDVTLTSSLTVCTQCLECLNNAYIFKCKCLKWETAINKYLQKHLNKLPLDLNRIKLEIEQNESETAGRTETCDIHLDKNLKNEDCFDIDLLSEEVFIEDTKVCYTCNICNKLFENETIFTNHKCDTKSEVSSVTGLNKHKENCVDFKSFLCKVCSKAFKTRYHLKRHTFIHQNDKVSCTKCDKTFISRKLLSVHVIAEHMEKQKENICSICNSSFPNSSRLKRHKDTHTEDPKYNCKVCEKSFKVPAYLQRHMATCHVGVRRHICDVCGMKFSTNSTLLDHIRTHTGERPFKCEVCGKGFGQRSTLMVHVKSIHSNEKPYACEVCSRTFTLKGNLKAHMVIHMQNVEKKYICTHCNKRFRINKDLQRHIKRHLGIKTHTCPICKKGFMGSTALKIHLRSHTGERPYECDICNKKFSQRCNLQLHLRCHRPKTT